MTITDVFSERDLRAFGIFAEVTAVGHLLRVVLSHDDLDQISDALKEVRDYENKLDAALEEAEEMGRESGHEDGYDDALSDINAQRKDSPAWVLVQSLVDAAFAAGRWEGYDGALTDIRALTNGHTEVTT